MGTGGPQRHELSRSGCTSVRHPSQLSADRKVNATPGLESSVLRARVCFAGDEARDAVFLDDGEFVLDHDHPLTLGT